VLPLLLLLVLGVIGAVTSVVGVCWWGLGSVGGGIGITLCHCCVLRSTRTNRPASPSRPVEGTLMRPTTHPTHRSNQPPHPPPYLLPRTAAASAARRVRWGARRRPSPPKPLPGPAPAAGAGRGRPVSRGRASFLRLTDRCVCMCVDR
jgi:hypothetical protein